MDERAPKDDERRPTGRADSRGTTMQQLAPYMGLGLQLTLAMVLFGGLGYWLDTRFGLSPWLLISGLLIGAIGGTVSIIRATIRSSRRT